MVGLLQFEYFDSSVLWTIAKATTLVLPALALDFWNHTDLAAPQVTGFFSTLHSRAGIVEHVGR